MIDYIKLHIFNKKGYEIPLTVNSYAKLAIKNKYGDHAKFHLSCDTEGNVNNYITVSKGGRFQASDFNDFSEGYGTIQGIVEYGSTKRNISVHIHASEIHSSNGIEYCIDELCDIAGDTGGIEDIAFPAVSFAGNIEFDKISTELIETQSLYILAETVDNQGHTIISKISDIPEWAEWAERFKLLFYIDCRDQKDFRLFRGETDEIIWSDKQLVDLSEDYRINIGFMGEDEGVYEEPVYICLVDTEDVEYEGSIGKVYPFCEINMYAEAVGEDERYRTLFTNFGIPDPKTFINIYKDTDPDEAKVNMESLNRHSKELFLSYADIFPYIGTYKALLNAVKVLGYDDIFFKEWYKDLGSRRYIAYDMQFNGSSPMDKNTIEERIHLKKLNWISLMYHLNEEDDSQPRDKYGFPILKNIYTYSNEENMVKLISMKKWLEKYITGLHCRIIDIGGEGIYYEKYINGAFGGYQSHIIYDNERNITPVCVQKPYILVDSSVNIEIDADEARDYVRIEDIGMKRFSDFSDGFIDASGTYIDSSVYTDSSINIHVGATLNNTLNIKYLKALSEVNCNRFIFDSSMLAGDSARTIFEDGHFNFMAEDCDHMSKNTTFANPPVIVLKNARLINPISNTISYNIASTDTDGKNKCIISSANGMKYAEYQDYISLIPPKSVDMGEYVEITPVNGGTYNVASVESAEPTFDFGDDPEKKRYFRNIKTYGLRYSTTMSGTPVFFMTGYQTSGKDGFRLSNREFILDIKDGYMIFNDENNNRKIYINFNYDVDNQETIISMTCKYYGLTQGMVTYHGDSDFSYFSRNVNYESFRENYLNDPETAISINDLYNMPVKTSGVYSSTIYAFDNQNNIFCKKALGTSKVSVKEPSLTIFTNTAYSENDFDKYGTPATLSEIDLIKNLFNDFCVLDYEPMYTGIEIPSLLSDSHDESIKTEYPVQSYEKRIPKQLDYAHFVNISDRFYLTGVDAVVDNPTYYDQTTHTKKGAGIKEYYLTAKRIDENVKFSKIAEYDDKDALRYTYHRGTNVSKITETRISNVLNKNTDFNRNQLSANIIFYNETGGFPLIQVPGFIANAAALSNMHYKKDDYHIYIPNDFNNFFVWVALPAILTPAESALFAQSNLLTITVNNVTYYAVTAKDQNGDRYYIKKSSADGITYETSDILYVGDEISDDMNLDMILNDKALINNRISIYIQPTWKISVDILDVYPSVNQMRIRYNNEGFKSFVHNGQMIKLILDSPFNPIYNGQASYKVISSDLRDNTILLEGMINKNYIANVSTMSLSGYMDLTSLDSSGQVQYRVSNNHLEHKDSLSSEWTDTFISPNGRNYTINAIKDKNNPNIIYYGIYVDNNDDDIIYQVMAMKSNKINVNCYIAHSHEAFADYQFRVDNAEYANGKMKIDLQYSKNHKKTSRFIDKTFGVVFRKFDTDNIPKFWMQSWYDENGTTPDICKQNIYKYDCPVRFTQNGNNIVLHIDPATSYIYSSYNVKWSVYRRSDAFNDTELILVSNNKILSLSIEEMNTYDVEYTIMDKYGNSYTGMLKGFCRFE